jgi:hypothetical protein
MSTQHARGLQAATEPQKVLNITYMQPNVLIRSMPLSGRVGVVARQWRCSASHLACCAVPHNDLAESSTLQQVPTHCCPHDPQAQKAHTGSTGGTRCSVCHHVCWLIQRRVYDVGLSVEKRLMLLLLSTQQCSCCGCDSPHDNVCQVTKPKRGAHCPSVSCRFVDLREVKPSEHHTQISAQVPDTAGTT